MLVSNRNLHVSTRWMPWEGPTAPEISPTAPLWVQQIDEGLPFGVAQGAGQAIFASARSAGNSMRIPTDTKSQGREGGLKFYQSQQYHPVLLLEMRSRGLAEILPFFPIIIHKYPMIPMVIYQASGCQQAPGPGKSGSDEPSDVLRCWAPARC
jgi:hypothetical protein